jgi:hypothetical protein
MAVTPRIKLRAANLLQQETELPIANEHAAHPAFSGERLEILFDQAALRV